MNATSFFKLIKAGDQEGLERALREGYEPDAMCRGLGALHELAKSGPVELLAPLLEHGADLELRCQAYIHKHKHLWSGATPLFVAVNARRLELVLALLQRGADPNARDDRTLGMLHLAALLGDAPITRALLEGGARVNLRIHQRHGPFGCSGGDQALHCAVRGRRFEIVRLLCEAGAELEHENIYQEAPLTLAKKDAQIEAYLRELLA